MGPLVNVIEKSKGVKVSEKYDLQFKEIKELLEAYQNDPVELMFAAFNIGYMQGAKAERAKRRC